MGRNIVLIFDGGSRGNPGPAYGSFVIRGKGVGTRRPERLDLGHGTNNQAEYLSLIAGLESLISRIEERNLDPALVHLRVLGDSQLVLNQLNGSWKTKSPMLKALRTTARGLLDRFGEVELVHQDRASSYRVLGH